MAKIATSSRCIVCLEQMRIVPNMDMNDFIVTLIQFHKAHEICHEKEKAWEASLLRAKADFMLKPLATPQPPMMEASSADSAAQS